LKKDETVNLSGELAKWYEQNKRELPWRFTNDPYKIWLSEIILQQTRVNQGWEYYEKFVEHFPTIIDLANAKEDKVLKLWQGLGYYSRARNLHFAAKQVVNQFKGIFPSSYEDIIQLKGVGEYTASAIASIAFNEPKAVVDGNVYRVLARLFGIKTPIDSGKGRKQFAELAFEVLDKKNPGNHNQAMMEFGALQCTPKNPDCGNCIFKSECFAFNNDLVNDLPVKEKKVKITNRFFVYCILENSKGEILIEKRVGNDIWKGLYQFPLIELNKLASEKTIIEKSISHFKFKNAQLISASSTFKHILSHQRIEAVFVHFKVLEFQKSNSYLTIYKEDIINFGIPKLIENYVNKYEF